jgi:protein SCO1/2
MVTMASLGGFMFVMFRRDLKLGREHNLTANANDKARLNDKDLNVKDKG